MHNFEWFKLNQSEMVDCPEFWSERYQSGKIGWDLGEVSTPIKSYCDQLRDKHIRILIPGCGRGWEALYLIENGFTDVHVLDFAPEPLGELKERSKGSKSIHVHCADLFDHTGSYDLILEQTLFCAIDPSMRKRYISKIAELLNSGGKYVGVLFDRQFEGGPPFGGSKEDYLELMQNYFSEVHMEACHNSIPPRKGTEVFFIARKP